MIKIRSQAQLRKDAIKSGEPLKKRCRGCRRLSRWCYATQYEVCLECFLENVSIPEAV